MKEDLSKVFNFNLLMQKIWKHDEVRAYQRHQVCLHSPYRYRQKRNIRHFPPCKFNVLYMIALYLYIITYSVTL